jgi:hypothetical protein
MKLRTSRGAPGPRRTSGSGDHGRPRVRGPVDVLTMPLRLYSAAKRTRARLSRAHARSDTDRDSVHATPDTPRRAPLSALESRSLSRRAQGTSSSIIVYSSTLGRSRFGFCCIRTLTSTSLHGARCRRRVNREY